MFQSVVGGEDSYRRLRKKPYRQMSFKNIFREIREKRNNKNVVGSMSRQRGFDWKEWQIRRTRLHNSDVENRVIDRLNHQSKWANLPPELLREVIKRLDASERSWPSRRHVVACASVCKSWREITKQVVQAPEKSGMLTFPISLKQPGTRNAPIQCFMRRDRETSTFHLYHGQTPALLGENEKLLFSAKKFRRAKGSEFVISLAFDDFSRASNMYIGKLRSNFWGTKFTVYDCQPPSDDVTASKLCLSRRIHSKQVSPRISAGNYDIATINYESSVLRTKGPRKMQCTMHYIPLLAILEGGVSPNPTGFSQASEDQVSSVPSIHKLGSSLMNLSNGSLSEPLVSIDNAVEPLVLKNKAPRWHEQLQCWCLNFRGRVTVASVKNFQLVAAVPGNLSTAELEKVILQFGKIGKDIFTMDYCYPLSAFEAFAICLSCFDTKPVFE